MFLSASLGYWPYPPKVEQILPWTSFEILVTRYRFSITLKTNHHNILIFSVITTLWSYKNKHFIYTYFYHYNNKSLKLVITFIIKDTIYYVISTWLDKGGWYFCIKEFNCSHKLYNCFPRSSELVIIHWNFRESFSNVLYRLNMVELGVMFAHIIKLHWVSYRYFLNIWAFSIESLIKFFDLMDFPFSIGQIFFNKSKTN